MNRPNVYIDLDRTLFKTAEMAVLWNYVATYFGVDDAEMERQASGYYVTTPDGSYYHDFGSQLRDLGLDPEEVYQTIEKTDLADDRFLYPGARELVAWLSEHAQPSIVTFGADDYQRFKVALCPSLAGLSVVTTQTSKLDLINTLPHEGAWLIDDRPLGPVPPSGLQFIQVNIEGKPVEKQSWPVFETLKDVQAYLSTQLHS